MCYYKSISLLGKSQKSPLISIYGGITMKRNSIFASVMSVIAVAGLAACLTGCGSQTETANSATNQAQAVEAQAVNANASDITVGSISSSGKFTNILLACFWSSYAFFISSVRKDCISLISLSG